MKKVSQTRRFSRDVKRMRKRGKDLQKLQDIVKLLAGARPFRRLSETILSLDRGTHRVTATLKPTGS